MRRGLTIAAVVISSVSLIGLGAGCGGGDSAAVTPEDATTIANNAPQTDSEGKTVPAPGGDSDAAPAMDEAPADGGADAGAAAGGATGDVAAGKTAFEANCQGCHPAGGTQAGVGPQLSNTMLDTAALTSQIVNGKGSMPGGLVSGADLENVVAYVESLKG